jgi:hypothetical protein
MCLVLTEGKFQYNKARGICSNPEAPMLFKLLSLETKQNWNYKSYSLLKKIHTVPLTFGGW